MAVPYTFGSATTSIPLSQLDSNFATTITLGNTAIQLGNTVTTLNNMTLANATVSSGNATVTTLTAPTHNSASSLTFQTNGTTTAITVDTSQKVGIGTASPNEKLVVNGAIRSTNNAAGATATADSGVFYFVPTADAPSDPRTILQGVGTASVGASIAFFTGTSSSNTERMRINAGAPILCLAGGSTTATGTGIAFPATQSASSDANTLDDYEEGTWTPTDTSGAGLSFTGVVAQYVKVGSMLVAQMSVTYPSTANGNQAAIGGLPFTTANFDDAGGFNRYGTNAAYIFPTLSANGTSGSLFTIGGTGVSNVSLSLKRIDLTYVYRTT